jgi:hypothetical protein
MVSVYNTKAYKRNSIRVYPCIHNLDSRWSTSRTDCVTSVERILAEVHEEDS